MYHCDSQVKAKLLRKKTNIIVLPVQDSCRWGVIFPMTFARNRKVRRTLARNNPSIIIAALLVEGVRPVNQI